MTTLINASTSSGIVVTSDNSGEIALQSNGATKATLGPNGFSYPGAVLQVISVTKTDTFSMSSGDYIDVTGLSVSITPTSISNKILVFVNVHVDSTVGGYTNPWRIVRNSTPISVGNAAGSRRQASGGGTSVYSSGPLQGVHQAVQYLDSPATTSSTIYKVQLATYTNSAGSSFINRGYDDADSITSGRYASSITVMEIAQ